MVNEEYSDGDEDRAPLEDESPDPDDDDGDPEDDAELIALAKRRFQLCVEAESNSRKDELDDMKFMTGEQWDMEVKHQRQQDGRPCLTVNRLPAFCNNVSNDIRQNRPSIKVNPQDNKGDIETAKVMGGMIRHIEYASHADIAYDRASEYSVRSGLGYFRLLTKYLNPMSFQQEICIGQLRDRFSVYLDPWYQEPDGSDAEFGFIFQDMARDEFKVEYPGSKVSSMSDWTSTGDDNAIFVTKSTVRVCEYYYIIRQLVDIVQLSDGKVVEEKNLPQELGDLKIIGRRKALVPKVKWAKLNGLEVLERKDIPGYWIPIIPVLGEDFVIEGKRIYRGLIREAKDAQRMYNFWVSAEAEMIALAPKAPWIAAEGQIEGYEQLWQTANVKNHHVLPYKPKSIGGVPVPPPQRTQFSPEIQVITLAKGGAAEDLKAITGMYDPSMGSQKGPIQSGRAIQRQVAQGQLSNFHYSDNLSRSLRHAGRIMVNWIPEIYKDAQAVRTVGEDGSITMIDIKKVMANGRSLKSNFTDMGEYDVTVSTGPSFQTRRQEAVGSMLDLTKSVPQAMQYGLDLLIGNMDWPGSDQLADRMKKMLPPQLTQTDKMDMEGVPPQAKAHMVQLSQMVSDLSQKLNTASNQIATNSLELKSKERIALMNNQTQLAIELMKHKMHEANTIFEAEQAQIDRKLQGLQDFGPAGPQPGGQPAGMGAGQPVGNNPNAGGAMPAGGAPTQ